MSDQPARLLADGETLLLGGLAPDAARFRGGFVVVDGWTRLEGLAGPVGCEP